jgi:hypothetical protein
MKDRAKVIEAAAREAEAVRRLATRNVQESILRELSPKIERSVLEALRKPTSTTALEVISAKMVAEATITFDLDPESEMNVHIPDDQAVSGTDADVVFGTPDDGLMGGEAFDLGGDDFDVFGEEEEEDASADDLVGEEPAEEEEEEEEEEEGEEAEALFGESIRRSVAEGTFRAHALRARGLKTKLAEAKSRDEVKHIFKQCTQLGGRITEDAKRVKFDLTSDARSRGIYETAVRNVYELFQEIGKRKLTLKETKGGTMKGRNFRKSLREQEELELLDFDDETSDLDVPADTGSFLKGVAEELEGIAEEIEALLDEDETGEEELEEAEPAEEVLEEARRRVQEARRRRASRPAARVQEARRPVARPSALLEARKRQLADERRQRALLEAVRRERRSRRYEGAEEARTAGEYHEDGSVEHDFIEADELEHETDRHLGSLEGSRPTPTPSYKPAPTGDLVREARLRQALVKSKLTEGKLLLAAKITALEGVPRARKIAIVEAIDRAQNIGELKAAAKAIRASLSESGRKAPVARETVNEAARRAEIVKEARRRLSERRAAERLMEARRARREGGRLNETRGVIESSTDTGTWERIAGIKK